MTARLWKIGLLFMVAALVAAGCGGATATPTVAPTVAPSPTAVRPEQVPTPTAGPTVDRVGARDAALAYVRDKYGADAPAADLTWTEQHAKPAEMVGADMYQYMVGDWLISVSYPVVPPEQTVYTIDMVNFVTGFTWNGRVGAGRAGDRRGAVAAECVRRCADPRPGLG